MDLCSHLELVVEPLHILHRVRYLLHGLQLVAGAADLRLHPLLGIQPVDGVLQHVVQLLGPVRQFGLGVLPVRLEPVDCEGRENKRQRGRQKVCFSATGIAGSQWWLASCFQLPCWFWLGERTMI